MKKWLLLAIMMVAIGQFEASAQGCSVCTNTASQLGKESTNGLNKGIIYLAALPLVILGGLGFYWYRHLRSQ